MSFWNSLRISTSGLSAQRLRLDLIANNIANAETTRTSSGEPFQRSDVIFAPQESSLAGIIHTAGRGGQRPPEHQGVKVAEIVKDDSPGARVYDPSHPDADEEGYVTYPNVNLVVEMTNMLSATRSYEANLAMVEASKRMALKALEIGK